MDKTIIFFSFVRFFLITFPSYAQQQQVIIGHVLDQQTRQPLIGANITVPNTTKGTVTDRQGNFELAVNSNVRQIQVSYIGYVRQNITLGGKGNSLNILLEPDN